MNPENSIQKKISAVMAVNLEIFEQIKVIPSETEIVVGWNVHFNSTTRKLEKIPTISTVGDLIKGWSYAGEALEIIEWGPESLSFNLSTFPDIEKCSHSLCGVFGGVVDSSGELPTSNNYETFQAILRNLERVQVALGEVQDLLTSLGDIFDDSPEGGVEAMSKIVKGSRRYDLDLKCTIGRPERIKSPGETELEELVRTMMLVSTILDYTFVSNNERITLRDLKLTVFPKGILRFSELISLDLSENQLAEIPESIGGLVNLKYLNISKNQLSEIPESIGCLANLKKLYLFDNQLSKIPNKSIEGLTNLKRLDLSKNQFSEISRSIGDLINLESLDLSINQLSKIPERIWGLTNLLRLDLSENQLSEIPESIGGLVNLKNLNLSKNQISELPHTVKQLIRLDQLDISRNQFSTIPECTYSLENLTYFEFSSQNTGVKLSLPSGDFKYLLDFMKC